LRRGRRQKRVKATVGCFVDRLLVYSNASDEGDATLIAQQRKGGAVEVHDPAALPEITQRLRALQSSA
jgi:hypothetical protein